MGQSFADRRGYERYPVVLRVTYGHNAFALASGTSENVSLGGLFIITSPPLEKGTTVWINLFLPDASPPITADCEVAWSRPKTGRAPAGMGVRFVEITPEDVERLKVFFMAGL